MTGSPHVKLHRPPKLIPIRLDIDRRVGRKVVPMEAQLREWLVCVSRILRTEPHGREIRRSPILALRILRMVTGTKHLSGLAAVSIVRRAVGPDADCHRLRAALS